MTNQLIRERHKFVNSLVIFSLFFLFLNTYSSFASAEVQHLETVKQGDPVILTQTCSNCSAVNVTRILYPRNSVNRIINEAMDEPLPGNFNYTFTDTTVLGTYTVTTCGDPDGVYTCVDYTFPVTSTGNDFSTTAPIFLLVVGFLLLFLGAQYKIPIMGLASGIITSVSGVYLIIYGLGYINNVYTQGIGFTALFIGLWAGFAATYEFFGTGNNNSEGGFDED